MIQHTEFVRKKQLRRIADLNKFHNINDEIELPKGSILHVLENICIDTQSNIPEGVDFLLQDERRPIFFHSVIDGEPKFEDFLTEPKIKVRIRPLAKSLLPEFKKKFGASSLPAQRLEQFTGEYNKLALVSYNYLSNAITKGITRVYDKVIYQLRAMLNTVDKIKADYHHYVFINFEANNGYPYSDFTNILKEFKFQKLRYKTDPQYIFFAFLYAFLNDKGVDILFDNCSHEILSKINFIFKCEDKYFIFNLQHVKDMNKSNSLLVRFIRQMNSLCSTEESIEEDKEAYSGKTEPDLEIIEPNYEPPTDEQQQKVVEENIKHIDDSIQINVTENNILSSAQKTRIKTIAKAVYEVDMGGESIKDIISSQTNTRLEDTEATGVGKDIDPGMKQIRTSKFDKEYFKKSMKKDIASSLLAFSANGMYVSEINVTDKSDELSRVEEYKIIFKDDDGKKHRIVFTLPKFDENGVCTVNGSQKYLRKQMINLPICKVSPTRVTLSSSYNKTLVERVTNVSNNFYRYIMNMLKKGEANIHYKVSEITEKMAYEYTTLATTLSRIEIKTHIFFFNPSKRFEESNLENIKELEDKFGIFFGKNGSSELFFINIKNDVTKYNYKTKEATHTDIITLFSELLEIQPKPLNEYVTFKILDKNFPVIFVLGYQFGLSNMLKYLGVQYELHDKGTRITNPPRFIRVPFKDKTLVIDRYPLVHSLLISGLTKFKGTRDVNFEDMDYQGAYYDILVSQGISTNYLKGIDSLFKLFVDPITRDVLMQMGEPTNLKDLLIRATSMLTTEEHKEPSAMANFRIRSYEKVSYVIYNELARSLSAYQNNPNKNKKFSVNPDAVFRRIMTDKLMMQVETVNPIHDIKGSHGFSYMGAGGRDAESFVIKDRMFPKDATGIISESTVDSGKVGINAMLSANASIISTRGLLNGYATKDISLSRNELAQAKSNTSIAVTKYGHDLKRYKKNDIVECNGVKLQVTEVKKLTDITKHPNYKNLTKKEIAVIGDKPFVILTLSKPALEPTDILSTTSLLMPGATNDDGKRANFINGQMSQYVATPNSTAGRVRTGYEKMIAHQAKHPFAEPAPEDGKVIMMDEKLGLMKVKFKGGEVKVYRFGEEYHKAGGHYLTQKTVANVKLNEKITKGDILTYNPDFFQADPYSKQVDWKIGLPATVMFCDCDDSLEDSNAISKEFSEKLGFQPVVTREIVIDANSYIHKFCKVGDHVEAIEPLMIFEDGEFADDMSDSDKNEEELGLLNRINRSVPKAKHQGKIVKIEAFFSCDYREMHPTLSRQIRLISRDKVKTQKFAEGTDSQDNYPPIGPVAEGTRLGTTIIDTTTVVIRFYIQHEMSAENGDKVVFDSSLKSIIGRVIPEPMTTEGGTPIDGIFGNLSQSNRIILSPVKTGIANRILSEAEKEIVNMYFT